MPGSGDTRGEKLRVALALVGFVVLWDRKFPITPSSLTDAGSASNTITKPMSGARVSRGYDEHGKGMARCEYETHNRVIWYTLRGQEDLPEEVTLS